MAHVTLPREILPTDGRFGCGPSKIRPAQVAALAGPGAVLLGTSHRQAPVKGLVGQVRAGLSDLLRLPACIDLDAARLIDRLQRDLPLSERPFADVAAEDAERQAAPDRAADEVGSTT